MRPADGWTVTDRDVDPDEIEIDFERDNVEWEIEVQIEGGILEVEIDQDIDPAEPGLYTVGAAGVVEFALDGGALQLLDATANDGWDVVIDEETATDIEVQFRRGNVEWEFDVDLGEGVIEIEIDFEIEGSYP